ncbi:hypothetical protein RV10_GL004219 [Enterococcus pallens]|nr:hypothetical protein RV10_GL004219 [Enterococcus pallens]
MNGFQSDIHSDGQKGMEAALTGSYDLILLDVMLPTIDGIEIIRRIRKEIKVPILMVSAKSEEVDKLRGLGLGADDYISKPFSPTELVARVKANLAQYQRLSSLTGEKPARKIDIAELSIQPEAYKFFVKGQEVALKHKEFELLLFLMENIDHVFSKEELYERIWGMDSLGDLRTVAVHINRLREKIETDPANPKHLQTVWGAGYRFVP